MVVVAQSQHSKAGTYGCNSNGDCTDQSGVDALATAKRLGDWANVPFGVGIAGLGLGTVLWFTAPSSKGETPKTSVSLSPGGVLLNGRF
jgi:hypothetical protein